MRGGFRVRSLSQSLSAPRGPWRTVAAHGSNPAGRGHRGARRSGSSSRSRAAPGLHCLRRGRRDTRVARWVEPDRGELADCPTPCRGTVRWFGPRRGEEHAGLALRALGRIDDGELLGRRAEPQVVDSGGVVLVQAVGVGKTLSRSPARQSSQAAVLHGSPTSTLAVDDGLADRPAG